jgi:choice-of-anchor B domain-containing protein
VGRLDATAFVEVTNPAAPVYLGELPLHQGAQPNLWREIKVYKNHAYIVSDGAGPHGMQIFDLTQLRDVKNPPLTFKETAHYDKIHSAHNIVIDEESGFAYTVGNSMGGETCGGALHIIDIRDPVRPAFVGCFADTTTGMARTGYTHDAQCVVYRGPDTRYAGRQICFNSSETALGIADVTDKKNPQRVSTVTYPNVAYAHQGWLSEDHRYFFLNDEGDELSGTVPRTRTLVFDVSDLDDPVVAKEFLGTTSATDHNLYVKGRYMYQSNYVAGLRVIDVSDPKNPSEVGHLDTVPFGEDVPGFAGTWSNYPFFKNGAIGVVSMREGLFLVRYRPQTVVP